MFVEVVFLWILLAIHKLLLLLRGTKISASVRSYLDTKVRQGVSYYLLRCVHEHDTESKLFP